MIGCGMTLSERKEWALRQGNPLWLWPEIDPHDWQRAMAQIESMCTAVLASNTAVLDGQTDAVGLAAYTSGMGPLLGWWLEHGLVSPSTPDLADVCLRQLHANGARMERLLGHARAITSSLASADIEATLLKGAHTAISCFPAASCRPMADIDILVPPSNAAAAAAVLRANGYREAAHAPLESTWVHADGAGEPNTVVMLEADDPWTVDLHVSLDIPGPPGAPCARLSLAEHLTAPSLDFPGASRLRQPVLLLHLAAHAGSGFHSLTLLRLVEIVLVARRDRAHGSLCWSEFIELGEATGALAFAFPALDLARRLSPKDIPHSLVDRCAKEAPARIRHVVKQLRPATAHRINRPTMREHFAWTQGAGGWLRRLAADLVHEPGSLSRSAAIHTSRVRGLLRRGITRPQPSGDHTLASPPARSVQPAE